MDHKTLKSILKIQKNEITEYYIYNKLANLIKNESNSKILKKIAEAEKAHYSFWKEKTKKNVKPNKFKIIKTVILTKILGLTFVLKRMEKNEGTASKNYSLLQKEFPEVTKISNEEVEHEKNLLNMLDEEKLQYVGSIVLGLNDALVELTGALAGFTLALKDTRVISLAGLVTGISAALSMAASDYLSSKAEGDKKAAKSALYTGVAYLITVILMILPYLLLNNNFLSLAFTLSIVILIIFFFNYYISVAKDYDFKKRFIEMAFISLGVAGLSFGLGWILKIFFGIET